jgi:transposase
MARPATRLTVSEVDLQKLQSIINAHSTPQQTVLRCRIVLLSTEGTIGEDIAASLGISRAMVMRWQARYGALGVSGLQHIQPGRGRKPVFSQEQIHEVVTKTATTIPEGSTHWSTRTMAKATGMSSATIGRIWHEHGLKPHQVKT